MQEEISQGAGRVAGYLGLNNLIMFYDSNEIQLSTECSAVSNENTAMKYRSWNWNVLTINGNSAVEIREALDTALNEKKRPTLIIGRCVMGKGCRDAENNNLEHSCKTHGSPLGADAFANTVKNLGGDPENPFAVKPAVEKLYADRKEELKGIAGARHATESTWAEAHPEEARKEKSWFSGTLPDIKWEDITTKDGDSTRNASGKVLEVLGKQVENMVCASADLCNSDKTEGFLKQTSNITKDHFEGQFFQAGVSEMTMACCMIGMMLHGGVTTAMGTFFVFSDYMKPAIRMSALMEIPVKYIWTHDSFRVGEDGPTHEPIEQEAQIRLMEKVKNHSGRNSMLVLRPADVKEAIVCWKMAYENHDTPTALIFSRQNVGNLPEGTNYSEAARGGYIVVDDPNPEVILIASGSEVSTLVDAAALLKKDGVHYRIVSVPSEGLFRSQSAEYQEKVLPGNIKKFGLTAGLTVNLESLAGQNGRVYGVNTFGYSAPFKVLNEKLGFTAENIYRQIKDYINK